MILHKKRSVYFAVCAILLLGTVLTSCGKIDGSDLAENNTYADYDVAKENGIDFDENTIDLTEPDLQQEQSGEREPNYTGTQSVQTVFEVRVADGMDLYEVADGVAISGHLAQGTVVELTLLDSSDWAEVRTTNGSFLGYVKDGLSHAVDSSCRIVAQLPTVYGEVTIGGKTAEAYSHLVDVRQYFNCCDFANVSFENTDLTQYDLIINMKLATSDTASGKPYYKSNLCLVQYDMIPKLQKAAERFRSDGYIMVICNAYCPTSLQKQWTDAVKAKWGDGFAPGGVYDRGVALDITLIGKNGKEPEMPTSVHTFSADAAYSSEKMTEAERKNATYLRSVMKECGFSYADSAWWYFYDPDAQEYLATNFLPDAVPRVVTECK